MIPTGFCSATCFDRIITFPFSFKHKTHVRIYFMCLQLLLSKISWWWESLSPGTGVASPLWYLHHQTLCSFHLSPSLLLCHHHPLFSFTFPVVHFTVELPASRTASLGGPEADVASAWLAMQRTAREKWNEIKLNSGFHFCFLALIQFSVGQRGEIPQGSCVAGGWPTFT